MKSLRRTGSGEILRIFFRYSALYDLAIPMKDQIVDTNSNVNMVIYNKNTFNDINHTENN